MISRDIIELNERIKELETNRQTLENELDETVEYADHIARTYGADDAKELPGIEIEIDRIRLLIEMIDDSIAELQDEIEEIRELLGLD